MFESIIIYSIILVCIVVVSRRILHKFKSMKDSKIESVCEGSCPGCSSTQKNAENKHHQ